jgi:MSHA pilin protein MshC
MVELVIVIILVGILGAIAVNRFFDRSGFDAASFADQAGAALRFAQKEAIAQQRPVFVHFNGQSVSLCFDAAYPCSTGKQVQAPFSVTTDSVNCTTPGWYCVRKPAALAYTVSLGAVSVLAAHYTSFDALGRPFSDVPGTPTTGLTLNISGNGASAQVNVVPETGYVF